MKDEKNIITNPRFGILNNGMETDGDTCIKRLINTKKKSTLNITKFNVLKNQKAKIKLWKKKKKDS